MTKDYAAERGALLKDLDGLRVEVDAEKKNRLSDPRPATAEHRVLHRAFANSRYY